MPEAKRPRLHRRLLARPTEPAAVEILCCQARLHLAALTAVLGGLDRLVVTGGIGAKAPAIRTRICASLVYLGIALDTERNTDRARVISADASRIAVEALATERN